LIPNATCEATPIFNTGATQTLTLPGRYCLAENITAAGGTNVLVINGNSIFVDLNGYTLTVPTGVTPISGQGIFINDGFTDIHIYNGFIDGANAGEQGIYVGAANDVSIRDVVCANTVLSGISLNNSIRTLINNVTIHNTGGVFALSCLSDRQTRIIDSIVTNSVQNGIGFTTSVDAYVSGCSANANASSGIVAEGGTLGIEIINCVAQHNTQRGFIMTDVVVIENCVAQYNTGNGFEINSAGNSIVTDCIAANNTGFGFASANVNNQFYKNEACNNTAGNYTGVVTAAVMLPNLASAWQNVACTLP
jgi:hypothetical protein